uniref:MD-2-related lipid-recognition domain-containing protein n=1 Tax=Plectus sambesii TaxID=2011161 RepID=A0A914UT69_9BILA
MFRLALTVALLAVAYSFPAISKATCPYPNSTDTAIHFFNCAPDVIQVQSVTITDDSGASNYPIDLKKPINLNLKSYDSGADYVADLVNVKLYEYTTGWLDHDCSWRGIPTFGMLDGINGCNFADNCPLDHGNLNLNIKLDLTKYAPILALLAGDKAYEIEVHMLDNNPGSSKEEIACVVNQLQFIK